MVKVCINLDYKVVIDVILWTKSVWYYIGLEDKFKANMTYLKDDKLRIIINGLNIKLL